MDLMNEQSSSLWTHPEKTSISHLPVELLINVFHFLDYQDLQTCNVVNKQFHSILGPGSPTAQPCWRGYRLRLNLPNPADLGLTEFRFLQKLAGTYECDFCKEYVDTEPEWVFYGHSFCSKCFQRKTIKKHFLVDTLDPRQFSYLPEVRKQQTRNWNRNDEDPSCVFRTDVIRDHIPDEFEIEQLKKVKTTRERTAKLVASTNFQKTINEYALQKRERHKSNVWNWLLYKYPILTREELRELSELDTELTKTTSIDTVASRQRIERVALDAVKRRLEMFMFPRFATAFESSSRPKHELIQWEMYEPFWKGGLLARSTLPSKEEILAEMEKHVVDFEKQLGLIHKRFAMLFKNAHDFSMQDIKDLMTTESFQKVQEDEFAERCKSIRSTFEHDRALAAWKEKYGVAEIKFPWLIKELESDPNYGVFINESACIELVSRLKLKQTELIKRAKEQIRKQCGNDEVFTLLMTELTSGTYLQLSETSVLQYPDEQWKRLSKPDLPRFKCRNCSQSFADLDSFVAHATSHGEDQDLLAYHPYLKRIKLGLDWISLMTNGRRLDIVGKAIAIRTYPDWEDAANTSFIRFQSHVEQCQRVLHYQRSVYDDLVKKLNSYWPDLFSAGNEEKLEKYVREILVSPNSLAVIKKTCIFARRDEMLSRRVTNFYNPRSLSKFILDEFDCCYYGGRLPSLTQSPSALEIEIVLNRELDRLVRKWKPVDDLCPQGLFDEIMGTAFAHLVETVCLGWFGGDPEDYNGEAIDEKELNVLKETVQDLPETRESFFLQLRKRVAKYCGLPSEIFQEWENAPIFCLKTRFNGWKRCSFVELVNRYFLIEYDEYLILGDTGYEYFVIGMQLNWMNEPDVLKL